MRKMRSSLLSKRRLGLESRPYSTSPFIRLGACFHSLKILSTKEGQRGILKLLSLTPFTRRWGRLSFQPLNCSSAMLGSDSTKVPGRRSSTVGSRRVRFGSRARTINRRCTILAATYVFLDLTDSSNWIHTQRRTTSSGLDERESISIKKLLGVSSERKSPAFISSFIFIAESTKRGTSLIVVIRGHLWSFTSNVTRSLPVIWSRGSVG